MKECSKSIARRMRDPGFLRSFFVGDGVDIGGKPDPLALYASFFPGVRSVRPWDLEDGDVHDMAGVADGSSDFVHSSHCLEHLRDPSVGLASWFRILKPGGHIVCTVPDEDLYEQGVFPSTFNRDHKWTFTILKKRSWSDRSINVLDLVASLGEACAPVKIELLDASYRYDMPRFDQTLTPVAECGIEFVLRKRTPEEIAARGTVSASRQPEPDIRVYFNQYKVDHDALVKSARTDPPFRKEDPL